MTYLVSGLEINKVTVYITEQTLREIVKGLDRLKKDKPQDTVAYAESKYDPIRFLISIETKPNTQESLGYQIK